MKLKTTGKIGKTMTKDINYKSAMYLDMLTMEMESDDEMVEDISIDEIRKELSMMGADSRKHQKKLNNLLLSTNLKNFINDIIKVITEPWIPELAGVPVTASDIPTQKNKFRMDFGEVDLSCFWKPEYDETPAYLSIKWKSSISVRCELIIRFINPKTYWIYSEISLGTQLTGEELFIKKDLGFDPSSEKWSMALIFNDIQEM